MKRQINGRAWSGHRGLQEQEKANWSPEFQQWQGGGRQGKEWPGGRQARSLAKGPGIMLNDRALETGDQEEEYNRSRPGNTPFERGQQGMCGLFNMAVSLRATDCTRKKQGPGIPRGS